MDDFTTSQHCSKIVDGRRVPALIHCRNCRRSAACRKSLGAPETCPWGFVAVDPSPSTPVPPGAAAICADCADGRSCPNVTICCGGQVEVRIVAACPRGRF